MKLLGNYLKKLRLGDGSLSRTIIKETTELHIRENQITLSNYIKIKNFSLIKNTIKTMKSQEWRRYLQNISEVDNHYFTRIVIFFFFLDQTLYFWTVAKATLGRRHVTEYRGKRARKTQRGCLQPLSPHGELSRPQNRSPLVLLFWIKKGKGWSAQNLGVILAQHSIRTAAVAAAASVPSSSTSTKVLCATWDRSRSFLDDIVEKSALVSSKASVTPRVRRTPSML